MADLNIMKALNDPELIFQVMFEPSAARSGIKATMDDVTRGPTPEEVPNDFDPEFYVQESEIASAPIKQLLEEATQTSTQETLCMLHSDSTYERAELELVAIENWMELLHTQTKSCIFLARGNWQARQAATAISMAKGRKTCILSEKTCWACIADYFPNVATGDQMVTFIA